MDQLSTRTRRTRCASERSRSLTVTEGSVSRKSRTFPARTIGRCELPRACWIDERRTECESGYHVVQVALAGRLVVNVTRHRQGAGRRRRRRGVQVEERGPPALEQVAAHPSHLVLTALRPAGIVRRGVVVARYGQHRRVQSRAGRLSRLARRRGEAVPLDGIKPPAVPVPLVERRLAQVLHARRLLIGLGFLAAEQERLRLGSAHRVLLRRGALEPRLARLAPRRTLRARLRLRLGGRVDETRRLLLLLLQEVRLVLERSRRLLGRRAGRQGRFQGFLDERVVLVAHARANDRLQVGLGRAGDARLPPQARLLHLAREIVVVVVVAATVHYDRDDGLGRERGGAPQRVLLDAHRLEGLDAGAERRAALDARPVVRLEAAGAGAALVALRRAAEARHAVRLRLRLGTGAVRRLEALADRLDGPHWRVHRDGLSFSARSITARPRCSPSSPCSRSSRTVTNRCQEDEGERLNGLRALLPAHGEKE